MNSLLTGLEGVFCLIYDVLVFGASRKDHDDRLDAVLRKLQNAGVMLNRSKCAFLKDQVKFLGHVVNKDGTRADPEKISAIVNMKTTSNITELRRLLGMANQLGKLSPNNPTSEIITEQELFMALGSTPRRIVFTAKVRTYQTCDFNSL